MLHWACSLLSLCICLPHLLFFCLFKPSSRQPICLTYPRMLSLGAGRGWSRVRVRSSSMTAPSMFLNLTCCFYLFFYLLSPHADRLWRENSNGILYIDLFLFFKKYNYYDYFFAMVASGHLSVGTSRIFRERKKVCVCVWTIAPCHCWWWGSGHLECRTTHRHTHTRKYVRIVEPNEKEQWAERASGWLAWKQQPPQCSPHTHTQTGLQTHTNTLAGVSPSCSESQEKQTDWGLLPTHVLLIEHTVTHVHLSDTQVCAHICSIISVCVLVS